MNKLIEQLAKQAGMVEYPTGLGITENTIWGDRNIEKFAELIAEKESEMKLQIENLISSAETQRNLIQKLFYTIDLLECRVDLLETESKSAKVIV